MTNSETLYNGIVIPSEWPPENIEFESKEPMPVPYLKNPPGIIPIDSGRQLFVDDFLIQENSLARSFHYPEKYEGNPILRPETDLELGAGLCKLPCACPKSGGVWYDYGEKIYKMWYEAGWLGAVCLAVSHDGLNWERPELDVFPGTNRVSPFGVRCDSWTVVHDYRSENPEQRYKMFLQEPCANARALCMTSSDGVHWSLPTAAGMAGDRSTMFYNPFRKKWCFSLRSVAAGRSRHYWEGDDFLSGSQWGDWRPGMERRAVKWVCADKLDLPDPEIKYPTGIYNLDAVAYESIMLGFFQIHRGPENGDCAKAGLPKITDLNFAYSRDGFHWSRPDRTAAIKSERKDAWDRGYVQSLGNICAVGKDKIMFYFTGFRGDPKNLHEDHMRNGMYANGATGVAFLRRDGFVSMDAKAPASLTTRPLRFTGERLFVNADCPSGVLRAEILDSEMKVIEPFRLKSCAGLSADTTAAEIRWRGAENLAALKNRPVRFRFELTAGKLYSFWTARTAAGRSGGYLAGGGPDYKGPEDTD
jgi:hypothetical protein